MATISVDVLCPSGHTVTVKVSQNDPVFKILESVCMKRGLEASKYFLIHYHKRLDSSLLIRYTSLANKAKLEMHELTEDEVQSQKEDEKSMICIQLKNGDRVMEQFHPDTKLADVLKNLETQGKLVLKTENDNEEPMLVYMTKEIVGYEELACKSLRSLGITAGKRELVRLDFRVPGSAVQLKFEFTDKVMLPKKARVDSPTRRAMRVDDGRSMFQDSHTTQVSAPDAENLPKQTGSEAAVEPMELSEPDKKSVLKTEKEEVKVEETVPEDDMMEEEDVEEPVIKMLGKEKNVLLFKSGEGKPPKRFRVSDDDDSIYDLSVDEVRRLYQQQVREAKRLAEGEDLLFKSTRDARKLNTLHKYKRTLIRVQFPDQNVLQILLGSWKKVDDLKDVLKEFLEDPEKPFQLFTSPPKTYLDPKETLLYSECVPTAVVYFSRGDNVTQFLREDILNEMSNAAGASKAANAADLLRDN